MANAGTKDGIERDVLIDAPLEVVWDVVTRPEHIRRWFSPEVEIAGHGEDRRGSFVRAPRRHADFGIAVDQPQLGLVEKVEVLAAARADLERRELDLELHVVVAGLFRQGRGEVEFELLRQRGQVGLGRRGVERNNQADCEPRQWRSVQ